MQFYKIDRLFSKTQCGFKKHPTTIDHLLRLDTYARKELNKDHSVLSIYYHMEKAYDKTWRHGILKDMHCNEPRGRFPVYITNIMSKRMFKIKI